MDKLATWGLTFWRRLSRIWIRLTRNRDFGRWQTHFEPDREEWNRQRSLALDLENPKSFTLHISVTENELDALRMTVAYLQSQSYPFWHLRIQTRMGSSSSIRKLLDVEQEPDSRISIVSNHLNTAGEYSEDPVRNEGYAVWLRPGDCLAKTALWEVVRFLEAHPEIDLVYADEDQIDQHGGRHTPWFKPDWSPELLYSVHYLAPLFLRLQGFDDHTEKAFIVDGAINWTALWDLSLSGRSSVGHLPRILLHRLHTSDTASAEAPQTEMVLHKQWVRSRFQQLGKKTVQVTRGEAGGLRVSWASDEPLVSILIPTRGVHGTLDRCLKSLTEKTNYPSYEILVLDSSGSSVVENIIEEVVSAGIAIRRMQVASPFGFSRANNEGARAAAGQILLFLNDDVQIIQANWLEELVRWVELPEIGAVGAKLLYPNMTLQHYGVILGLSGHANHVFQGADEGEEGPFGSTAWYRNFLAITGACMMLRRDVFDRAGGFDERYEIAFSDIELCLRLHDEGLRVMVTPHARLIHREGSTRGRFMPFQDLLIARDAFLPWIETGDPYYNPNLSYASTYPRIALKSEDRLARLQMILERAAAERSTG